MGTNNKKCTNDLDAAYEILLSFEYTFYKDLRNHLLKKGYLLSIHTKKEVVMNILECSLHYFADRFEKWCIEHFKNSNDVGKILWLYSSYEKAKNNKQIKLSDLDIIGLYVCRYILSISPNLILSTKENQLFIDNNIWLPELFALANCIGNITQFRTVEGVSEMPALSIDLISPYVKIDYLNSDLESLLQKSRIKGEQILSPQYVDYSIALDFNKLLIDEFGEAASSLLDAISELTYDSKEDIIPKDFSPYITRYGKSPFVEALVLDKKSVNFYNVVSKPHNNNHRTRFKPLIELSIDGESVVISSKWLIFEALSELYMNRLPFNGLPTKWLKNKSIKKFADFISNKVGNEFERIVASRISKGYAFQHDVRSVKNTSIEDFPVYENGKLTNRTVGQIDFIVINSDRKTIYIADAKHLKSKYITASFYNDKSKFDEYYIKLKDKVHWAENNTSLISELFDMDLTLFNVQGLFITDAYVFYALFVNYPIIPLIAINQYFDTNDRFCYLN